MILTVSLGIFNTLCEACCCFARCQQTKTDLIQAAIVDFVVLINLTFQSFDLRFTPVHALFVLSRRISGVPLEVPVSEVHEEVDKLNPDENT